MKIDLNYDMGESFGVYCNDSDRLALPYVSSINVACGFHASDPMNMRKTVKLAKEFGVCIGAHPSYPDLVGFGRRLLMASPEEITADIIYQTGALLAFTRSEGMKLNHIKCHGALYNEAARNPEVAKAVIEAVLLLDVNLILFCPDGSCMAEEARKTGIRYIEEIFADRAYMSDGKLVPRNVNGSVINSIEEVRKRVIKITRGEPILSIDGEAVTVKGSTICVHSDTPGSIEMLKAIHGALTSEGLEIKPPCFD